MDLLESVRRKIRAAMDHDEDLQVTDVPVAEHHEKPMAALIEATRQLLVAGEYEKVLALQVGEAKIDNPELANLVAWAHVMQGNILAEQAGTKTGAEADRLWVLAGEKYAAALAIKPDLHEALNNWGNALDDQA